MIQSIRTHQLSRLIYAAGLTPTSHLISLALPGRLIEAAKVHYLRTIGGPRFTAPRAGVEGKFAWHFDALGKTVTVATLDSNVETMSAESRLALVDELMDRLDDRMPRAGILREVVVIAEKRGASLAEVDELKAYARAAGL